MAVTVQERLIQYIREASAMEQNVDAMLDGMIETTEDPEMRARLEQHKAETAQHIERLRARLDAYGEAGSALREMAGRMQAALKGFMDAARGDRAGRNARDAYVAEHLEIAAYQLLERVALTAGDEATAEVARLNRADEEAMARYIDGSWDRVAAASLREEGALA